MAIKGRETKNPNVYGVLRDKGASKEMARQVAEQATMKKKEELQKNK